MELLGLISGDNSEVEDLSGIDNPMGGILNIHFHRKNGSQVAMRRTVVGARTPFTDLSACQGWLTSPWRIWSFRSWACQVTHPQTSFSNTAECVSIDEQMIPCWQYLPMKPNPVGMNIFVCATANGIVLDFQIYQGANALLEHVEKLGNLGLGGLAIDRLSQSLQFNTDIDCDRFFTSIRVLEHMLKKQMYITGTVMKNRIAAAVQKLPNLMKKDGRSTSFNCLICGWQIFYCQLLAALQMSYIAQRETIFVSNLVFAPMINATVLRHQINSFAHYCHVIVLYRN